MNKYKNFVLIFHIDIYMKYKNDIYQTQQNDIINKILDILQLDKDHSFTLYSLDNNEEKKQKISDLIPDIRKYFNISGLEGISRPEKLKRPYLSIIKNILKERYTVVSSGACIKLPDETIVKTMKYYIYPK
jgi:hypothetical protein